MEYKIINTGKFSYMTIPRLEELGLKNMITMNDLSFKFDEETEVEESKKVLALCKEEFDTTILEVYCLKQIHSDIIKVVEVDNDFEDLKTYRKYFNADGLITNSKNVILFTKFADCIPIVLYDYKNKVQANIHSGWRGTSESIVLKGLKLMKEQYGSKESDILVVMGPAIGKDDFEVMEDVYKIFKDKFSKYSDTIVKKDETHWLIDTKKINRYLLLENGILDENIISIDISTFQDERFHSYRRDNKNYGLMAFLTLIK